MDGAGVEVDDVIREERVSYEGKIGGKVLRLGVVELERGGGRLGMVGVWGWWGFEGGGGLGVVGV